MTMKVPTLRLRLVGDTAVCGHCGELLGTVREGRVRLAPARGEGWVQQALGKEYGDWVNLNGFSIRIELVRMRRRRPNPLETGPSTRVGADARPFDIVRCPKCRHRQGVPANLAIPARAD
jgi:ribosomal protein L34E